MESFNTGRNLVIIVVMLITTMLGSRTLFAADNLLINPDAETGDTQGWVDIDDVWSAHNEITPHGGNYFFWPHRDDIAYTRVYQDINISEFDINSGNAYFHLSGWLANWDQYPHDRSSLAIESLDANNNQLLYLSRHHRSPAWTYYKIQSQIPAETRTLRVYLIATRYVGSDSDGYFDDLRLEIHSSSPDTVVTVTPEGGITEIEEGSFLQLGATNNDGLSTVYRWSSSFEAVATVDENGLVKAHKPGRVVIHAEENLTNTVGYIELIVYSENDVIFNHPQGGEKWITGTHQNITWELKGNIDSGTLYYSTTGGSEWTEIDKISDLTVGQYSWPIPVTDKIMNDCIIKMLWSGGEAASSIFAISPNTTQCFDGDTTIAQNLDIHVPNALYQGSFGETNLWMDLKNVPSLDKTLVFEIVDYGAIQNDSACSVSTENTIISQNLDIHIPNVLYQGPFGDMKLWVDFKYVPNSEEKLLFEVTDYGVKQ
ncbi:MAG: hypothetical protein GY862_09035 [Gammaproteobacteria bacterium]|nr:hypothetical protein [Gammaproteobacteria bacterium]